MGPPRQQEQPLDTEEGRGSNCSSSSSSGSSGVGSNGADGGAPAPMKLAAKAPRLLQDEEALPLVQALELDSGGCGSGGAQRVASKQHRRRPLAQRLRERLRRVTPELVAIALVYFVQGILRLSSLAITFFEKDHLRMEPTQMALADTISALPWTVKPLYGFVTDSVPIAGLRRRPYLVLAGLMGSLSWLCLAAFARSVPSTVACITTAAAATAFSDVVADSIVVELARASPGATEGALQSLCWGSHAFGRVVTAYLSGWLVDAVGPRRVFAVTATFPLVVCLSSCLINEAALGEAAAATAEEGGGGSGGERQSLLPAPGGACRPGQGEELLAAAPAGSGGSGSSGSGGHLSHRSLFPRDPDPHLHQQQQGAAPPAGGAGGGGGKGKAGGWEWLRRLAISFRSSVLLFWGAIKRPHVLRPVVFLFLWQAMPGAGTAMFYFKTNKLGFDAEFFGRVKLVAALADLLGIVVYNSWLKSVRLRPMMLWGSVLGFGLGLTPLMLVEGVNRRLGISDRAFALVDSALLSSIGQVLMMPTLVLAARLCPEGVEATLYASLMSLNNAAAATSDALGAVAMRLFGITSSSFGGLSALLVTTSVLGMLPLPLIGWVPDETAAAAAADGADEADEAAAGGGGGPGRPQSPGARGAARALLAAEAGEPGGRDWGEKRT